MNVLVLFGGVSSEHEISVKSATSILNILGSNSKYNIHPVYITKDGYWKYIENGLAGLKDLQNLELLKTKSIISPESTSELILLDESNEVKKIKIDVAFPILHGKNGEDGTIQGLFELANMKYVGCNVSASANSMDKSITKIIVDTINIPQSEYVLARKYEYYKNNAEDFKMDIDFPVFVKPCSSGSSVGVSKVNDYKELHNAIKEAFLYDDKVLVEKGIVGKEIEVAVLGNDKLISSVVGEIEPAVDFYSFDAKYQDQNSKLYIPARISEKASDKVRKYAEEIYTVLGCTGLSRVDFFITENEDVIFNEINTLPGFTDISMYPKLMEKVGISYEDLVCRLIDLAVEKVEN